MKLTKSYCPSGWLSKYIFSYNFYEVSNSDECSFMVPEGVIELVFQFDTCIWQREWTSSKWIERPKGFIGGLHKSSFYLKNQGQGSLLSIRIMPGSFSFFCKHPVNIFQNKIISMEDIWTKEDCDVLCLELVEAQSQTKCIAILESFLQKQFSRHKYDRICQAAILLFSSNEHYTLDFLSQKYNLSQSRFRAIFGQVVGCSPKQYLKTRRINAVINGHRKTHTLTELAYAHGYYDQAHFTRDFKAVTGLNPSKFSKDLLLHDPVQIHN